MISLFRHSAYTELKSTKRFTQFLSRIKGRGGEEMLPDKFISVCVAFIRVCAYVVRVCLCCVKRTSLMNNKNVKRREKGQ